jgi:hypothetical protein
MPAECDPSSEELKLGPPPLRTISVPATGHLFKRIRFFDSPGRLHSGHVSSSIVANSSRAIYRIICASCAWEIVNTYNWRASLRASSCPIPTPAMPRQPSGAETRLTNITACLTPALALLNALNDVFGPPFVQPVSSATLALIKTVQVINFQDEYCSSSLFRLECETK